MKNRGTKQVGSGGRVAARVVERVAPEAVFVVVVVVVVVVVAGVVVVVLVWQWYCSLII